MELANSLLLFIEENYPQMSSSLDQLRFCDASRIKINAIRTIDCLKNPHWRAEGKETAQKILYMAQRIKSNNRSKKMGTFLEAHAHGHIGYLDNYEEGIKHLQMAREANTSNCTRAHWIF